MVRGMSTDEKPDSWAYGNVNLGEAAGLVQAALILLREATLGGGDTLAKRAGRLLVLAAGMIKRQDPIENEEDGAA